MTSGLLLTKATIWLSLAGYGIGAAILLLAGRDPRWRAAARPAWTLGCALLLAHLVCAFHFHHRWSHAAAYAETARQTSELVGWMWGGGVFVNYVFTVVWTADVAWWWLAPASHARRSPALTIAWHGFAFFMVFNGAVVFASGFGRCLGVVICGGLGIAWWLSRQRTT